MIRNIKDLLRDNIKHLEPYKSARVDFKGFAEIYLDANESPYPSSYNRYPDPHQLDLKKEISKKKNVPVANIFFGNGSDEIIDLLIRAFCNPGKDKILTLDPTYGMYAVCASVNDVGVIKLKLDKNFGFKAENLLSMCNDEVKIIFICSPNNPSGNAFSTEEILSIVENFEGIVVLDEAYIDFSKYSSLISYVNSFCNLVVLQTLSKAYAGAALRIGMAYADEDIIEVLNKIKPPYNISGLSQKEALRLIQNTDDVMVHVSEIKAERERVEVELKSYKEVLGIYPSETNFLLVRVVDATTLYGFLIKKGIVVRNRHGQWNCDNCLRITIGTKAENQFLLKNLNEYYNAEDIVFG